MIEDPNLTPWVIPRWAIEGFIHEVKESIYDDYFVSQIVEHSPTHYLVITSGYNLQMHERLKHYLKQLFEVKEEKGAEE